MASEASESEHLDATERPVVFCHACSFEWYRDEHGLECPSCQSEITELVSLDNDPRHSDDEDHEPSPSDRFDMNEDSDPEEADIEEHMYPNGFSHSRSTRVGEGVIHHDPISRVSVERFLDVITNIGGPFRPDGRLLRSIQQAAQGGQGHIHETMWSNGTSSASVTFFTTRPMPEATDLSPGDHQPFQTLFAQALSGFGATAEGAPAFGQATGFQGLTGSLGGLGELFNFFNGVHGDGVYTQEALDRIITSLMDANPQSNAAPPATEEGLANLPRKTIDEDLRSEDGNTDCSICIDAMQVGEVAVALPCKHAFHEECVVLWLKEHNTCPVCRAPMEQSSQNNANPHTPAAPPQQQNQDQHQHQHHHGDFDMPTEDLDSEWEVEFSVASTSNLAVPSATLHSAASPSPARSVSPTQDGNSVHGTQSSGSSRPPNQSQTRINEAMRYISSQHEERDRSRTGSPAFLYDTSRLQRRNSHSPTSPRVAAGDGERSMRERSPSQSSRRTDANEEDDRHNNNVRGAMGWLRNRFADRGSRPG